MKTRHTYLLLGCTFFYLSAKAQILGATIDVQHYTFALQLNDEDNIIKGKADITIKALKNSSSFNIDLVKKNAAGKGMLVSRVLEGGKPITFRQDSDDVKINTHLTTGTQKTYSIIYEGIPADGLIISTNKFNHRAFFGDNWPNRAHNWLPCVDEPADKAPVDFIITAPDYYQVVANGLKVSETKLPNQLKLTHWKETAQLPTKVMVIGVADFAIDHPKDVNGIPVYTYVFPENKDIGFKSYAVAADILPFYMGKIGQYAYQKLANVQSKTIFGGMENASAIFYFENSVGDRGIEELMAHEIAHQWFGDAVSEKDFHHLWLSEGFATYLTNYYLENKYGIDTLKKRMDADRRKVIAFEKQRFTPVVDSAVKDNFMPLLNANSYEKGAWALHMLRRKLGDTAFWKGISAYYAKYKGGNANTTDFRRVMEQVSGQNLALFFKQWLHTAGHPDLGIVWKYDNNTHRLNIQITQKQKNSYVMPLEVAVDGHIYTINIKNTVSTTDFTIASKPTNLQADPNVNLLASFTVTGN
ncbi:MAG TPA: M1 family metallopeptidase [Mucilaginibacter sp.]|nr:M1 family metallopeptidase [Mucilaginibacter sp.]